MVGTAPRRRAQLRNRNTILAAARELVLSQGAGEVSLRAIAARAGFSPAGLYEYFAGKDELIGTLATEAATKLDARLAAVPAQLPPARRLVRLGMAYVNFSRQHPQDFLMLFTHLRSRRRSRSEPPDGSPFGRVVDAVRAAVAAGAVTASGDAEIEGLAYGLWSLVHGMAMLQLTHLQGYQADFEDADRRVLERFVAGLA